MNYQQEEPCDIQTLLVLTVFTIVISSVKSTVLYCMISYAYKVLLQHFNSVDVAWKLNYLLTYLETRCSWSHWRGHGRL